MKEMNLFMILIGCTPKNRLIEQHDMFFGIANELKNLIPSINNFWPEANGVFHIDCWRKVTRVGNYNIEVIEKTNFKNNFQLFFINLGGYLPNEFEEYHHKQLIVAKSKAEAIKKVKETEFYKKFSFKGAQSHIDDYYGVAVDEIFIVQDILYPEFKEKYQLKITEATENKLDKNNIGYLNIQKMLKEK